MTALDDALWPRATLPRRPMLGAVLDALTSERDHRRHDALPSVLLRTGVTSVNATAEGVTLWKRDEYGWGYEWTTRDPAEAYELLQARDLIPMSYVGRFVCGACDGTELTGADGRPRPAESRGGWMCACHGEPQGHPPTVAALASWASLGFAAGDDGAPGILGAEELAAAMSPDAPPRWRVAPTGADTTDGSSRAEMAALRLLLAALGWTCDGGDLDGRPLHPVARADEGAEAAPAVAGRGR